MPLKVLGQIDVHVERGDGVLLALRAISNPYRVANSLNANPIDGDLPIVTGTLYIRDSRMVRCWCYCTDWDDSW